MAHFRLAHLSDLHFSSGVYAHAVHEHSIVRLRGVERFFSDTTFDRVLVTGDLTNAGDPDSLLRARTWLFSDFETAPNDRIGLRLDPKRVIVVPGNHDAFNCRSHSPKPLSLWQKSLDNYNTIFEEHSLRHPQSVRFDWVEKEGVGLFIVYADTSYIGDGELDDLPSFVHPLKGLPDMAKGKFTRAQTEQILEWFDRGVRGKLTAPGANEHIPRQQFMDSLKIMVAHHYLFEAPGQKLKPHLHMRHRRTIFGNLASADFDLYICGHKHIASAFPMSYASQLRRRESARFLMNVFRRLVGLTGLPLQVTDEEGATVSRSETLLFALYVKLFRVRAAAPDETATEDFAFEEALAKALREGLSDPTSLEARIQALFRSYGVRDPEVLSSSELKELVSYVRGTLDEAERAALKKLADRIEGYVRTLVSRPFVQSVGASTAKETKGSSSERGLELIDVCALPDGYLVNVVHYAWSEKKGTFEKGLSTPFMFEKGRNPLDQIFSQ